MNILLNLLRKGLNVFSKKNCNCADLKIPSHLHRNSRKENQSFSDKELLYRRFPKIDTNKKEDNILPDGKVSISIFSASAMSCNREKYSKKPEDVLYNIDSDQHFFNYGVVSISVKSVNEFSGIHPTDNTKVYKLKVRHSPVECMYPHIEVFAEVGGNLIPLFEKPASIRTAIKAHFQKNCLIVKRPD